jgi:hypothetical protein
MKKVFSSAQGFETGFITSMLEEAGIAYTIRNQYLSGAIGELPPTECWPEIWVNHDEDYNRAMDMVNSATLEIKDNGPWRCGCGEKNEGQFASCWKCGKDRASD